MNTLTMLLYCGYKYITNIKSIKDNNNRYLSPNFMRWLIDEEKKVLFFNNPKVACTSIMASMFNCLDVPDRDSMVQKHLFGTKYVIHKLPKNLDEYYKFGFVRNPFARLVSFWENRYENNILKNNAMNNLEGYLKYANSFEDLVYKISKIPSFMFEPHFALQYPNFYRNKKCIVDFIGKFETIEEDYKPIQEKFNFVPLPHFNKTEKTKKWQDYYTLKTVKLVYKIYKQDIMLFNYEKDYNELLEYIKSKNQNAENSAS